MANGVQYVDADGRDAMQSSIVAHQMLQTPFELLCISITTFILGLGVYLGSAWKQNVDLGVEQSIGNRGVLIAFCVATAFCLGLMGQALGGKDFERHKMMQDIQSGRKGWYTSQLNTAGFTPNERPNSPESQWQTPKSAAPQISSFQPGEPSQEIIMANLAQALRSAATANAEAAKWCEMAAPAAVCANRKAMEDQ